MKKSPLLCESILWAANHEAGLRTLRSISEDENELRAIFGEHYEAFMHLLDFKGMPGTQEVSTVPAAGSNRGLSTAIAAWPPATFSTGISAYGGSVQPTTQPHSGVVRGPPGYGSFPGVVSCPPHLEAGHDHQGPSTKKRKRDGAYADADEIDMRMP